MKPRMNTDGHGVRAARAIMRSRAGMFSRERAQRAQNILPTRRQNLERQLT